MTAIGKLLALLTLVIGLGILTWSVGIYVQRPKWHEKPPEGGAELGHQPFYFDAAAKETEALRISAGLASEAWGVSVKTLAEREKLRAERKTEYARRIVWAHTGNQADKVDKDLGGYGKGFYVPAIESKTGLYDLTVKAGLPAGAAIKGTNGKELPGLDGLLGGLAADVAKIKTATDKSVEYRNALKTLLEDTKAEEDRLIRMTIIRDSVVAERLFLETFEVNALETRATVLRREKQLRDRLRILGVNDP